MQKHKIPINQLLILLEQALLKAGFLIMGVEKNKSYHKMTDISIMNNDQKMTLHVNIAAINKAFLPNNSNAMRRQISALDIESLPKNTKESVTILIGYFNTGSKDIFAIWNAFYFVGHKKNRSCYVNRSDLEVASEKGLLLTTYSSTPVFITTGESFKECLEKFVNLFAF